MSLGETACPTPPAGRETQGLEDGGDRLAARIHPPIPKAPYGHWSGYVIRTSLG